MFIKTEQATTTYTRTSKLGREHAHQRTKTVLVFRCDNCDEEFRRDQKSVDPKRISNNYFHVCTDCDAKRFAQKKGVERRLVWDMSVNSTADISRL